MAKSVLIAAVVVSCVYAFAQSAEKEPAAIVELGGATGIPVKGGKTSFGPTIAVEITPIENWLELEVGVTPLFARRSTEWSADILFKKSWTLSPKMEFMVGVGPEWIRTNERIRTNSVASEAVVDFMYWPFAKHRFGWYLEPSYEYILDAGMNNQLA